MQISKIKMTIQNFLILHFNGSSVLKNKIAEGLTLRLEKKSALPARVRPLQGHFWRRVRPSVEISP
jgi:hypothetical protein